MNRREANTGSHSGAEAVVMDASSPDGSATALLRTLLDTSIVLTEAWDDLPKDTRQHLENDACRETLLSRLEEMGLISLYQGERIRAGTMASLVLGNYRVLGRVGSGSGGVVFEAEHILMRRKVALKVFALNHEEARSFTTRFLREMRVVAGLDHPHIVAAFDAGMCPAFQLGDPDLYYFAMEMLKGQDLEQFVHSAKPSVSQVCALIYQIAAALDEAQRHQLVHRDIKPSNIFVTDKGQAKLLDFGLVRHMLGHDYTKPNVVVGSLDYMAPEQAFDPTKVDTRTDIFSLGAVLFFALTGSSPFPHKGNLMESVMRRRDQQPLSARQLRPDLPAALENVLTQMLALRPEERMPTPQAVMHALLPYLNQGAGPHKMRDNLVEPDFYVGAGGRLSVPSARVLIVTDRPEQRSQFARALAAAGVESIECPDADSAVARLRSESIEVLLMSAHMQGIDAGAFVKALRDNPHSPNLQIILTADDCSGEAMSRHLLSGADDCLRLPISHCQLAARVKSALKHKEALDHQAKLSRQLLEMNTELERSLGGRTTDLVQARNALVLALARLVEYRSLEAHAHLTRMQRYCTTLAQEAADSSLAQQITPEFLQTLECCAPLHDIGNVGLPDHVLLKAGKLDEHEARLMQSHTTVGADTLRHVLQKFGRKVGFLQMAIDIARHHHEHYDGTGYPDHLAGNAIPLAARIVAIADAYDSLRSRRAQRPSLTHPSSLQIMLANSPGKFDPFLLSAFERCACQFERIFRDLPDSITVE